MPLREPLQTRSPRLPDMDRLVRRQKTRHSVLGFLSPATRSQGRVAAARNSRRFNLCSSKRMLTQRDSSLQHRALGCCGHPQAQRSIPYRRRPILHPQDVVRCRRLAPQRPKPGGALRAVPLAVQTHLGQRFAEGRFPARQMWRCKHPRQVMLFEPVEPGEFLLLRNLEVVLRPLRECRERPVRPRLQRGDLARGESRSDARPACGARASATRRLVLLPCVA